MKTEKQIKKRLEFINNVLEYGDEFLDIKLTPIKRRLFVHELKLIKWFLEDEKV